jgi:hypothetical protein
VSTRHLCGVIGPLLLFSAGLAVTPLVIVAVVVAHVTAGRLSPALGHPRAPAPDPVVRA